MKERSRGWVVAWVIVFSPLLLGFMGLVLDGGFMLARTQELNAATDAAALAATDAWDRDYWKWHGVVRIDPMRAESLAREYLAHNMRSARLTRITVNPPNRVSIETATEVPFFFMRIVGWKEKTVESFSTAVRRSIR